MQKKLEEKLAEIRSEVEQKFSKRNEGFLKEIAELSSLNRKLINQCREADAKCAEQALVVRKQQFRIQDLSNMVVLLGLSNHLLIVKKTMSL